LTEDGLARLTAELEKLKTSGRERLAERLNRAFDDGQDDEFVDNAELEAARHEQSFLEGRILELETILSNYEIIDRTKNKANTVQIGDWVTVKEVGEDEEERYMLVGAAEADPVDGRISNESPLGRALLNAKVRSTVTVEAPRGSLQFKIVKID
jgi:transcription elongation factor GreA